MDQQLKSRTVKIDGAAVQRLRVAKGWPVDVMAKKAKCSVKTVENVEKGANVFLCTLANFAVALGVANAKLVSGGTVEVETPKPERGVEVRITVSMPFDEFDQSVQLVNLLDYLIKNVPLTNIIVVKDIASGSTTITIELSEEDAAALHDALTSGKLKDLPIDRIFHPALDRWWAFQPPSPPLPPLDNTRPSEPESGIPKMPKPEKSNFDDEDDEEDAY